MKAYILITLFCLLIHFCGELIAIKYLSDLFLVLDAEFFLVIILISAFVNGSALFLFFLKAFLKEQFIKRKQNNTLRQIEEESLRFKANLDISGNPFTVFCGTFFFLVALMNSAQCAFSVHTTFQFSDKTAILYLRKGIQNLQHLYGKESTVTGAFDRIHLEWNCCGMDNALFEYRRSDWFYVQRRSPRQQLPPSCMTIEKFLTFISIKTSQSQSIVPLNIYQPTNTERTNRSITVNKQENKKYGCFEQIRQRIIAFATLMTASAFTCAIAQLLYAFRLLLMHINEPKESRSKLLTDSNSSIG